MTSPVMNEVAAEIAGKLGYSNLSFVADGSFKETYKAETQDGGEIALKLIDPAKADLCRSSREIDAMVRCGSAHIGHLIEHGECKVDSGDSYLFLVEEFMHGGTLTDIMVNPLSGETVRQYAHCLVNALATVFSCDLRISF